MNIVYVGGGVSTLFGVLKLLDKGIPGNQITILEAGPDIYERQENDILKGFGGCGTYSDGKFLFSLHSGGHIEKYAGKEKSLELFEQIKFYLRKFYPGDPKEIYISGIEEVPEEVTSAGLEIKQSEVWHMGTSILTPLILSIREYFQNSGVKIYCNLEVNDIDFQKKIVFGGEEWETFTYDFLVIAAGKYGIPFLQKIINKYNLQNVPKPAQFGVRFESEDKYFYQLLKSSYDFKLYKKIKENASIRTFCTNSKDAYVVTENYNSPLQNESYFTVNGHSYRDPEKYNGKINFGIMLEKGFEDGTDPLQFCQDLAKRCNGNGKTIKYYSPSHKVPTIKEAIEIHKGNIVDLYKEDFWLIDGFIKDLQKIFPFQDDYLLYLPEIKFLTNELKVNYGNLSLVDFPNVFVNGDSLSARGIVVSAAQGLYCAENLNL